MFRLFRHALGGARHHRRRGDRAAAVLALVRAGRYRREIALSRFFYTEHPE